jgi:hypothetical protein
MDHLHWQYLARYCADIAGVIVPCLLTLANRNDPICVASPKVAKASTICIAVTGIIAGVIALTFANGIAALNPLESNENSLLMTGYITLLIAIIETYGNSFSL